MLALFPEISQKAQAGDLESLAVLIRTYFSGDLATKPRIDALATVRSFGIPVGMAPIKYFGERTKEHPPPWIASNKGFGNKT